MRSLVLLKLLLFTGLVLCENENASQDDKFEYIFTYPQSMISKGKAKVCLTLSNAKLPVKLTVRFKTNKCGDQEQEACESSHEITKEHQCFDLDVPKGNRSSPYYINRDRLEIELMIDGQKKVKSGQEDVSIFDTKDLLFMETDRGRYKPGDLVRIRVLALEHDLTPSKNHSISKIILRNPQRNKVKVWEDVPTNTGLAQLEYQLQDSANTGYWNLEIAGQAYISFQVEQYILPRFKTTLEHPNSFYIDDKTIDVKVCAKYSYGRNVKGLGVIKVKIANYHLRDMVPISKSEKLKNGCVALDIPVKDLELNRSLYYSLDVTGSVTEQGTEETQTERGYMYMSNEPYRVFFDYTNNKLKPGLPFTGSIEFQEKKVNLNDKKFTLCYKFRKDWNDNMTTIDCQHIRIDDQKKIKFTIPPLKKFLKGQVIVDFDLPLEGLEEDRHYYKPSMYLSPVYSVSNNSLQIVLDDQSKMRHCGDDITFTVQYTLNNVTDDEITFNYLVMSRFDVVKIGHVNVKPRKQFFDSSKYENTFKGENEFMEAGVPIDDFKINLKLDGAIYTNAKLVVFYMTNGEVIADRIDINIEQCLPNKVDIKWNKDTLEPAEKATLKIATGEGSLCALTGIDKASTFQSPPDAFTTEKILRPTEYGRYPYYSRDRECVMPKEALDEKSTTTDTIPTISAFRSVVWRPGSVSDAKNIFVDSNVGVISNQQLVTKPCERHFYHNVPLVYRTKTTALGAPAGTMVASSTTSMLNKEGENVVEADFSTGQIDPAVAQASPILPGASSVESTPARTFFPETFLWDLVPTKGGQAMFEKDLPDSITNWVTKALCVSQSKGVGLSSSLELNVFKPFFVDVLMPYSIKRNTEVMHLPVAVFNYLNHSIPVRVTLGDNDDLELVDGGDKKTTTMCVEGGDSVTQIYRIKALKLGTLNVSVSAEMDPHASETCGSKKVVVKRDLVYKTTKVEAEGYPSDIVNSALLCANDSLGTDHVLWEINLPEGVVNDTVVGGITINSDILGPVIENLDNWLRVPTGCGEQTMAGLVPNLYVLRYLKSNNALTKEIEAKALKNMETGYQRILGYSHEDGSFSAFGKSDQKGSMFLTAFVVRTLRLMKEYITIQDDVIDSAVLWMKQHQNDNGCFDTVSHVFHPMGADGEKDNQTTALTSYVIISLKETKLPIDDEVISKAKECILRSDTADNYTLAISSYALTLMDLPDMADTNIKLLIEAADIENDKLFWKKKQSGWFSGAQDVEIAGYALLALLQRGTPEYVGYAGSVVRFLQTQMNPQGGYYSTQDSVVALDGMSRFANLVNKKEPNLEIEISTKQNRKHNLQVKKRVQNSKEEIPLVNYPEMIDIKVKGEGCVLGQAAVKFNVNEKPKSEALKVKVSVKSATKKNQCVLLEVTPCVSYNAKGHSNMALLEVSMPSGYVPDQASLHALQGSVPDVKKFELIENKVVLYFNRITSTEICTPFVIQETVVVENKADPTVKLYDYYTPDVSVSQSFKLPTCETDNAIDK